MAQNFSATRYIARVWWYTFQFDLYNVSTHVVNGKNCAIKYCGHKYEHACMLCTYHPCRSDSTRPWTDWLTISSARAIPGHGIDAWNYVPSRFARAYLTTPCCCFLLVFRRPSRNAACGFGFNSGGTCWGEQKHKHERKTRAIWDDESTMRQMCVVWSVWIILSNYDFTLFRERSVYPAKVCHCRRDHKNIELYCYTHTHTHKKSTQHGHSA